MIGKPRFPFTQSQWQELEHQALIFKYMVSGIPIPSDLLFTIKTSLDSYQSQNIKWSCFQVGSAKKIDPEPGRCRRTDGKKWRCSKEAYPDSKYCERHMHRGKNRSRKPVENLAAINGNSSKLSVASSLSSETHQQQHLHHHFYNPFGSSSRFPGFGLSYDENTTTTTTTTNLVLDSGSYSQTNSDYRNRYVYGLKEEVDEHAFFSEPSGTIRSFSSSSSMDQNSYKMSDEIPLKMERDEPQKTIHHFFDEWPLKHKDSSTKLSISIPTSSLEFPIHNDG